MSVRQFGGTFGVALAIAFLGSSSGLADPVVAFDSIWWLLVAGGLGTCLLVLPMRTAIVPPRQPAGISPPDQLKSQAGMTSSSPDSA